MGVVMQYAGSRFGVCPTFKGNCPARSLQLQKVSQIELSSRPEQHTHVIGPDELRIFA